jgi:hypothetical protein
VLVGDESKLRDYREHDALLTGTTAMKLKEAAVSWKEKGLG